MRLVSTRVSALSLAALLSLSAASFAQDFSLDECSNAPIGTSAFVPGLCGAEAPFGPGPFLAPSPTLGVFWWADSQILVPPPAPDVAMQPPVDYLKKMYFDCLVHDEDSLELLKKRAGADHIMIGTDFPAGGDILGGAVKWIEGSPLFTAEEKQLVLRKNAEKFLGLS